MTNAGGFVLKSDGSNGGLNWGFCASKSQSKKTSVPYSGFVVTSNCPESLTDSKVKIKLYGDEGQWENYKTISENGYDKPGAKIEISDFTEVDVGQPQKLDVKIDGSTPWRCQTIYILKDGIETKFECLKKLYTKTDEQKKLTATADGNFEYKVAIKTSSGGDGSVNKGPIMIILKGDKKISQTKIFSDMPQVKGQIVETKILTEDLGNITGFKLILLGPEKWSPELVTIESHDSPDKKEYALSEVTLIYPGDHNTYEQGSSGSSSGSSDSDDEGDESNGSSGSSGSNSGKSSAASASIDVNDPYGGFIEFAEKSKIMKLKCLDTLEESADSTQFGPKFPTKVIGTMSKLVECPHNCSELNTTVFGVGLHPAKSPICMSGIIDNAMSMYGGIMQITITNGLKSYPLSKDFKGKKIGNIQINDYPTDDSMKSFSLAKVDGLNQVEKDFRIVNSEGRLSNIGRLDIRLGGEWGTVCNKENTKDAATVICKSLEYKGGNWLSNECGNYNGKNYCGAPLAKIHFSHIDCVDNANEFDNCNKNFADRNKCDHGHDALINCFNENFENAKQIPNNNLSLGAFKKVGKDTIGRIDMAKDQEYLPVCGSSFQIHTANMMCKMMGYESGIIYTDAKKKVDYQFGDTDTKPFAVQDLQCSTGDTEISQCTGKYNDINCTHNNDVVIQCTGESGDPSGKSQFEEKVVNNPPKLGKLPLETINAKCDLTGSNPRFRGNPGSIFKVCCPNNCLIEPGTIWGTGLYSDDSNVCLAGIHNGIYNKDKDEGCFMLAKQFGSKTTGSYHIIQSYSSEYKPTSAFTVTNMNTGWQNMAEKFKQDNPYSSSFIELDNTTDFTTKNYLNNIAVRTDVANLPSYDRLVLMDHLFPSSFLELKGIEDTLPSYMFSFIEKSETHIFYNTDNYLFSESKMNKVNDFSLVAKFQLQNFTEGKNNVIFSFSGPAGFNLYLDGTGKLKAGTLVSTAGQLNLDYYVPKNVMISLYLVQNKDGCYYSIKEKGLSGQFKQNTVDQFKIDMPTDGFIGIGRSSSNDIQAFEGRIEFVEIYPQALDKTNATYGAITKSIMKRKKEGGNKAAEFTTDSRKCIMSCSTDIPGSGTPPPGAELDKVTNNGPVVDDNNNGKVSVDCNGALKGPLAPGTKCEGTDGSTTDSTTPSNGNGEKHEGGESIENKCGDSDPNCSKGKSNDGGIESLKDGDSGGKIVTTLGEPFNIEADATLMDDKFNTYRVEKKMFKVICPKVDPKSSLEIYGYGIYRANSSICGAALQWGALLPNTGGMVMVYVEGIQKSYHGSIGKWDIKSDDFLENETQVSFHLDPIGNMKHLSCKDTLANAFQTAGATDMILSQCPQNCDNNNDDIFGGNISEETDNCPGHDQSNSSSNSASNCIYSDDSPICKSAIHCGVLNRYGGFIKIQVQGEQPKFISQESFGINSMEKPSQVRSFSFVGDRAAIYASFTEDYKGPLSRNWSMHVDNNVQSQHSNAISFYENIDFKTPEGKSEYIRAIKFDGAITTKKPYTAACLIKKRDLEFANGLVQVNLIITGLQPVFMFVRFNDEQNHIGLKIDNTNQNFNHEMYIKYQGVPKTLGSKNLPMELNRTYRYKFFLSSDSVRVEVQDHKVRKYKELFNLQIKSLTRGTIAFGYNGQARKMFYLSGITIGPFRKSKGADASNILTWNKILDHAGNKKTITKFCKQNFGKDTDDYHRCVLPAYFCRYQCETKLPELSYGILNLRCVQECEAKGKEALGITNLKSNLPKKPEYKVGEMVDIVPRSDDSSLQTFSGKVTQVNPPSNGITFITVQWSDTLGKSSTNVVSTDSPLLFKCGTKLTHRKDCNNKK